MTTLPPINYPGVVITRTEVGIPVVEAPTVALGYEAIGYATTFDRPVQVYLSLLGALGEASTVLPSPQTIAGDSLVKAVAPTEEDALEVYAGFSQTSKIVIESYLKGVNARFQEIIDGDAPIPAAFQIANFPLRTFPLYAILVNLIINNGSNIVDSTQITNLTRLLTLRATNPANAEDLFNDFVGIPGVTKARWTVTEGDACGNVGDNRLEPIQGQPNLPVYNNSSTPISHTQQLSLAGELESIATNISSAFDCLAEYGVTRTCGSLGVVLGPQKVMGNGTMAVGGPQNFYTAPSTFYTVVLNTPNYGIDFNHEPGVPRALGNVNIRNGCYCNNQMVQTNRGAFGVHYAIIPVSETYVYATRTVNPRGLPPITVQARFTNDNLGLVLQPFPGLPGAVVVAYTPTSVIRALEAIDPILRKFQFPESLEDLVSYRDDPKVNAYGAVDVLFHDNKLNVGAITQFTIATIPGVDMRLPMIAPVYQPFLVNNPLVLPTEWNVLKPYVTVNERPYYIYYNGAWSPFEPTYRGTFYEFHNEAHVYYELDERGSLTYQQLRSFLVDIFNARQYDTGGAALPIIGIPTPPPPAQVLTIEPGVPPSRLSGAVSGWRIIADRFFQAVLALPTPQRLAIVQQLQGFDGSIWRGDTIDEIVNTHDVREDWLIANSWMAIAQINMLRPIFGPAFPTLLPPVNPNVPYDASIEFLSLFIRIIENPCNNPLFFEGYPDTATQNQIIVNALDQALALLAARLGARPWGENLRVDFVYQNPFVGPVGSLPYMAHATVDQRAEHRIQGIINRGDNIGPGIDDTILITPQGPAGGLFLTDLIERYKNFNFVELGSRLIPLSCLAPIPPVPVPPFGKQCCEPRSLPDKASCIPTHEC